MRNGFIFIIVSLLFLTGCGRGRDDGDIAAYVNKEPILTSELKRDIALRVKQDPTFKVTPETEGEQLELIINKKIIIQKAMESGLAREDRFVDTIKSFWEQTLIRNFLEYKRRTFQEYLYVTEDEIRKYYDELSERTTFKVMKTKSRAEMEDVYRKVMEDKDLEAASCETVGPVGCEEITSDVLQKARSISVGGVGKFDDPPYYYVIKVEKKDKVELEPLEKIRPEIEKRVIEQKEKSLFYGWLEEEKAKSRINVLSNR